MRRAAPPSKLAEREVDAQIKGFLEFKGWRPKREQRTVIPGQFQTGEPGIPDRLFIHYLTGLKGKPIGLSLTLWVEMKRPGAKMRCNCRAGHTCTMHAQMNWRAKEEQRGGIVAQVESFADFVPWYEERFGWLHRGDRGQGQLEMLLEPELAVRG